jgi:hypothetical protein
MFESNPLRIQSLTTTYKGPLFISLRQIASDPAPAEFHAPNDTAVRSTEDDTARLPCNRGSIRKCRQHPRRARVIFALVLVTSNHKRRRRLAPENSLLPSQGLARPQA